MKPSVLMFILSGLILMIHSIAPASDDDRYAVFRVVRAIPGEPSRPDIQLPDGYEFVDGERYHVASRAEYYTFVRGPESSDGIPVEVTWPGETIRAIVASNRRMELERDAGDPHTVRFQLPVVARTPNADQSTIQVWSHMQTEPGIRWRIEHNDPDRVAGPWTEVAWPAAQTRSVIHQLVASEAIIIDSGLASRAHEKGHFIALMGFETNNTLHTDNPPHWHLVYYAGNTFTSPAYLPHYWIDGEGRNFYNGMDVTGQGRQRLRAGDPGEMFDFDGNLMLTTTIREDGGLDIDVPGQPRYSIVSGADGHFVDNVAVLRDGEPWLRVATHDDVKTGVMVFRVDDDTDPDNSRVMVHFYDRLTGVLRRSFTNE